MRVLPRMACRLVGLALCLGCLSCRERNNGDLTTLTAQEAVKLVKEEMTRQTPFGIERVDETEYEIDTSITDDGDWLVMFNRKPPSSPGDYFFAIMAKDGKVQFWPGK